MLIKSFPSGPLHTNCYVFADTQQAAIIDPSPSSFAKAAAFISQHALHPVKILLTHSHWDHIADVAAYKQQYGCDVYVHALDEPNLLQPGSDKLPCWIAIESAKADSLLQDGDCLRIGNIEVAVIHTPGHSPGSVCFYCQSEGVLLSGDTLFKGSMGNISFPTSQPEAMWSSLAKLSKLPAATKVYPGHGPTTTIGEETWLANARAVFG